MKKDQVRSRVLQAVIAAEVAKGHLKWKVSDLARHAKVSRPLIYYHFGKTKKDILAECVTVIAEEYYGLSEERAQSLEDETIYDSLLKTRRLYLENPSLVVYYHYARMKDSAAGRQLIAVEKRYQQKLKKHFSNFSDDQIKGVHALFHGMITAPFLTDESLKAALKFLRLNDEGERK